MFSSRYPEKGLLGHMVTLFLIFRVFPCIWPNNFWQGSQKLTMEKRKPLQEVVLGKLESCMQKNEVRQLSHAIHKINSKLIKHLDVRPEIIKYINENLGNKLIDLDLRDILWTWYQKKGKLKQK